MKTYIKPISEIVLLGTDAEILDQIGLTTASIHNTDKGGTTILPITPGNPDGGNTDAWGGDAKKGSEWNGWDD